MIANVKKPASRGGMRCTAGSGNIRWLDLISSATFAAAGTLIHAYTTGHRRGNVQKYNILFLFW